MARFITGRIICDRIAYFFFFVDFDDFKDGVLPGVFLLSRCLLSGLPVDFAFLFGPGLSPI